MARKRASSSIEAAMQERLADAVRAVEAEHPNPMNVLRSYFGGRVIIDVQDSSGAWHRYEHKQEQDLLAAELADASTRRREVTHG